MTTSIQIDDELGRRIQLLADARQSSPHGVIQEALHEYVEREENRARFMQEAQESWDSYQESGLHLTGQEASAWLNRWGTDSETTIPKCHE